MEFELLQFRHPFVEMWALCSDAVDPYFLSHKNAEKDFVIAWIELNQPFRWSRFRIIVNILRPTAFLQDTLKIAQSA